MNTRLTRDVLRSKQGSKCCYCGQEMTVPPRGVAGHHPQQETLEHLRRKIDGGKNDLDNLALSCRECNVGRGSMDWLTYKTIKSGHYSFLS